MNTHLTLFVLRHGKAKKQANTDFNRPLTQHGQEQAVEKGIILKQRFPSIDTILCSAAVRTCETLAYLNIKSAHTITEKDLYLCDPEILLHHIHQIHQGKSALLIGHNPGLHQFAYDLLPNHTEHKTEQEDMLAASFPTCALAEFHFSCQEWSQLRWHQGTLATFYK